MTTRHFTFAELAAYNVPPDDPTNIEYDEHVLADEQLHTLKYTAKRRCVFRAKDGRTYAVEYEARIDTGDYEVGGGMPDNHGWYGDSVEAVEVEQRPVTVVRWEPVGEQPAAQNSEVCGKCRQPFDPTDTSFDGRARYHLTPYCRRCVDLCHDSSDAFHRCVICDS